MRIEVVSAPSPRIIRPKYGELIDALVIPGEWVRVPLAEITGGTRHQKQLAVQQASRQAAISVTTRLGADHIYVSRRP
ncbi:MAG: hypothetical protein ABSE46_11110 [Terracidiphilus sp.]|jgi:hypothetical protein